MTDDITFGPTDDTSGGNGLFCIRGSNRNVSKKDPEELDLKTGPIKYFCRHLVEYVGNRTQCIDSIFGNQWAPLVLLQYWVDWDIYCKI